MSARDTLVEVRDVSKVFGREPRRFVALEGVNLTIREGDFVGLLGPSGSGKSTLLRIIAGLTPPSSGEVRYRGEPLVGVNPHATIVFQTFALFPWLTVLQNVEVALRARGMPEAERRPRAEALVTSGRRRSRYGDSRKSKMPCLPGFLPVSTAVQAGGVVGGLVEASVPQAPWRISRWRLGSVPSSAQGLRLANVAPSMPSKMKRRSVMAAISFPRPALHRGYCAMDAIRKRPARK